MALLNVKNSTTFLSSLDCWGLTSIENEIFIGGYSYATIKVYDLSSKSLLRTLSGFSNRALGTDGINLYSVNSSYYINKIDKNTGTILNDSPDTRFTDISTSATFYIDTTMDVIFYTTYSTKKLIIKKYSDGSLITSYTFPSTVAGVTIANNSIIVTIYGSGKIYIGDLTFGITNIIFRDISITYNSITGIAYYNNKIYYDTYSNKNVIALDTYNSLGNCYTDISNAINIGDYILYKYTSTISNTLGSFSKFDESQTFAIPSASSSTPDGYFYWIYVGKDYEGRKKFIADRNIQSSIAWDTLNTAGIIDKKIIDLGLNLPYISYMGLLTGGVSATDTDNEWDQIIVNSTLNNTITAGDNNVWHWSGINSWTSSIGTTISNRIIRGNTTVGATTAPAGSTSSSLSSTIGFRPVILLESIVTAPIFDGNLLSSSIHNDNAVLTGSIIDKNNPKSKVQYKILLNDTQLYPESGYTDFMDSPVSINYLISNSLLVNVNNKITIIMNNELNKTNSINLYATLYNNIPNGILLLSDITTHSNNIQLTGNIVDTDLDKISYRILINDIEKLPWSGFFTDPYIDYTILNSDLNIGDNIIKVEYKDNYKSIGLGTWSNIITKTNQLPIINMEYINGSIVGNIIDPDNDLIQYKILINNKQVYPESNFTDFEQNCNINYQINRNDILIGKDNIITIMAQDELDSIISENITFVGNYIGLMFMDEYQQFYTTDIGELLQYLDFGTITLGQITEPVKVLVQNKYGFSIKDINLYVLNNLPNITVEFSKEENPFIATTNLILEKEYITDEMDYFYIRLNTSISSESVSGNFEIRIKATPLI